MNSHKAQILSNVTFFHIMPHDSAGNIGQLTYFTEFFKRICKACPILTKSSF